MMVNRMSYIILLYIPFIAFLLATEDEFMWDWGVVISSAKLVHDVDENPPKEITNALIADQFVAPIRSSILNNMTTTLFNESFDNLSLKTNINNIKLRIGHLSIKHDYQAIIDIARQINIANLTENDCLDLSYWLANAYLQTGKYESAENLIIKSLESNLNDRLYFLLAMTYEANNKKMEAKKKYASFIDLFPQSEYIGSAKIKTRILGRR